MKNIAVILAIIGGGALLTGCGGSKEIERPKVSDENAHEEGFRPSEYDMDVKVFFSELRKETGRTSTPSEPDVLEPPVIVPGFRVQLLATAEIDEANAKKAEAESTYPEEWFYIVYDPPVYKLRSGNYVNRIDADLQAKFLSEQGYPDAWVVPERIVKNTPPRIVIPPQEQEPPK